MQGEHTMIDPCLFILPISALTPAYMENRTTVITDLAVGDKVCVIELLTDDWMQVHWSTSGIGHTGYLHKITVHPPTKATAPIPYEAREAPREAGDAPQPATPPQPPAPPLGPDILPPTPPPAPAEHTDHQWTPPPPVQPTMPPLPPPVRKESFHHRQNEPTQRPLTIRDIAIRPPW